MLQEWVSADGGGVPPRELCLAPAFGCELPSSYETGAPSHGVDFLEQRDWKDGRTLGVKVPVHGFLKSTGNGHQNP